MSNKYYQLGGGDFCNDYWAGAGNTEDCCQSFGDKDYNANELDFIGDLVEEAICLYGQKIDYFIGTYNVSGGADNIYGEHTTTQYWPPVEIVGYPQLQEDALTLSRFGFESDDELTIYVPISAFTKSTSGLAVWGHTGHRIEPKADDVFSLKQYGRSRPFPRGPKYFIVTEVLDQDISEINALGGHYTWKIKAKRYEFSFEPGLSGEKGTDQVYDNNFSGRLSAFTATEPTTGLPVNPKSDNRKYPGDADTDTTNNTYDPNNIDDSIYGGYS